jgi:hypothetical protein
VLALDESKAFRQLRRSPSVAGKLERLPSCTVDSGQRPAALGAWLAHAAQLPVVTRSPLWLEFVDADSLRLLGEPAATRGTRCLRLCHAEAEPEGGGGHAHYTCEVFPRATARHYAVTRPQGVACGQLVQFWHDGALYHVCVPAGVEEGGSFSAAAAGDDGGGGGGGGPAAASWTVTKRYSEWVALDAKLRRQPSLAPELPPALNPSEKGVFTSKAEDTQRRAAALSRYVGGLSSMTPAVWFSTALGAFCAPPSVPQRQQQQQQQQHGGGGGEGDTAAGAAAAKAAVAMRAFWHEPMWNMPQPALEVSSSSRAAEAALPASLSHSPPSSQIGLLIPTASSSSTASAAEGMHRNVQGGAGSCSVGGHRSTDTTNCCQGSWLLASRRRRRRARAWSALIPCRAAAQLVGGLC